MAARYAVKTTDESPRWSGSFRASCADYREIAYPDSTTACKTANCCSLAGQTVIQSYCMICEALLALDRALQCTLSYTWRALCFSISKESCHEVIRSRSNICTVRDLHRRIRHVGCFGAVGRPMRQLRQHLGGLLLSLRAGIRVVLRGSMLPAAIHLSSAVLLGSMRPLR